MNCARTRRVIDAYLDGELDGVTRLELADHLAQCQACARAHAERGALGQRVRLLLPYRAPAGLRRRAEALAHVREAPPHTHAVPLTHMHEVPLTHMHEVPLTRRRTGLAWPRAVALAVMIAAISAVLGYHAGRVPGEDPLHDAIVARHASSLAQDHKLVDIASSDRHVVKPWLQGKVDFAPPVRELERKGYRLAGARLDTLDGRSAVAVVYRVRNHYVSHFVWRAPASVSQAPAVTQTRGYSLVSWSEGGLHHAAISDIEGRELAEFALLVRSPPPAQP